MDSEERGNHDGINCKQWYTGARSVIYFSLKKSVRKDANPKASKHREQLCICSALLSIAEKFKYIQSVHFSCPISRKTNKVSHLKDRELNRLLHVEVLLYTFKRIFTFEPAKPPEWLHFPSAPAPVHQKRIQLRLRRLPSLLFQCVRLQSTVKTAVRSLLMLIVVYLLDPVLIKHTVVAASLLLAVDGNFSRSPVEPRKWHHVPEGVESAALTRLSWQKDSLGTSGCTEDREVGEKKRLEAVFS